MLFAVLLAGAAALVYTSFDRIALAIFAGTHDLSIRYASVGRGDRGRLTFEGLNVSDKKTGLGIYSRSADIKISKPALSAKGTPIAFSLYDVNFVNAGPGARTGYTSLEGLASAPFDSAWRYDRVSGHATLSGKNIHIESLSATGNQICLSLNGTVDSETLDTNATISFAPELTAKMPKELADAVLTKAGDGGWKSFSASIRGNYKKPSIEVEGRLFRLRFKELSEP